jgi:hypothetical protein
VGVGAERRELVAARPAPHVRPFRGAREGRAWWLRALNAAGPLLSRAGRLDADSLWEGARRQVGADAEPAPDAVEALAALCASVERDAALHLVGRFAARDDTLRLARTHLRVERALRARPEILATPLPEPIFVVGWPRTGSTALHQLLACDPAHRTLPYWESFDPVPPERGPDRRPERVERLLRQLASFAPDYQAIHPMTAEMPEECVALFMNAFRTLQLDIQYRVPGYVALLLAQDARTAYEAYRRQLALLLHHRPGGERLVLKDPTHLVHLETLLALFPDARVVHTHREPAEALSSLCSLYAHTRAIFSDEVDPKALGRELLEGYWPRALEGALALRGRIAPGRLADVRCDELVRDPLGTVARLYRELGLPFTEAARAVMQAHLEAETRRPRGVHEHALALFGLSEGEVRERFADYRGRFW